MNDVDKPLPDMITKKEKEKIALSYEELEKLKTEMLRVNTKEDNIKGFSFGQSVYSIIAYAIVFTCYTGLRAGELSGLTWNDIDFEKKILNIDKQFVWARDRNRLDEDKKNYTAYLSTPKSKKSIRLIPLCDDAIEILNMIEEKFAKDHKGDDLIFTTNGNPLRENSMGRTLRNMCKRAGLPEIKPHDLRRTFGSILLNEDEKNLYTVSNMLGHSDTSVTYHSYIRIFEEKKAETVNLFNTLKENKDNKGENKSVTDTNDTNNLEIAQ
jgi:integrase